MMGIHGSGLPHAVHSVNLVRRGEVVLLLRLSPVSPDPLSPAMTLHTCVSHSLLRCVWSVGMVTAGLLVTEGCLVGWHHDH
ncbi:hypothetical protein CesoFtcFv8_016942 [Champsocephalus esox]|uniref:Uncharacterized protein n=1 Tax=Champsocephalus esox TaxID=159716 RepID=A0AAN8BIG8_9TELE|nr:hypothetical protein CesoFtcFv8_016942 [Champsocephalus esox]